MQNRIILLTLLLGMAGLGWGQVQKADPKTEAIERHYQYLETEAKLLRESIQKENEQYRKFIQEERAGHQSFLETTIKWGGGLLALAGTILAFFGWNTFSGINKAKDELAAAASSRLVDFNNIMTDYEVRFTEANLKLQHAESEYNRFLSYFRDANPRAGKYLMIAPKDKIAEMESLEIYRIKQAFGDLPVFASEDFETNTIYPGLCDVIIFRSDVDAQGESPLLQKIIHKIKDIPDMPLVIYSSGHGEYIKGATDKLLRTHGTFHLATTPVSLIDNIASTYRVAKMLPKKITS